jgi:MASE1
MSVHRGRPGSKDVVAVHRTAWVVVRPRRRLHVEQSGYRSRRRVADATATTNLVIGGGSITSSQAAEAGNARPSTRALQPATKYRRHDFVSPNDSRQTLAKPCVARSITSQRLSIAVALQILAVGMGAPRWVGTIGVASAVGVSYYLVSRLSLSGLFFYPSEGVTVFWAAAGISSGLLIGFGSRARWHVVAGVFVAAFLVPLVVLGRGVWLSAIFAVCDTAEPVIIAALIARRFGEGFALDQLRKVFGFLGATIAGTAPSSLGGAVASRLFLGPEAEILNT